MNSVQLDSSDFVASGDGLYTKPYHAQGGHSCHSVPREDRQWDTCQRNYILEPAHCVPRQEPSVVNTWENNSMVKVNAQANTEEIETTETVMIMAIYILLTECFKHDKAVYIFKVPF